MILTRWNPPLKTITKFVPWMKNPTLIQSVFSFKLVNLNHFDQEPMQRFQFPTIIFFIKDVFPPKCRISSLLPLIKGLQTFISIIIIEFFCISNLNTIAFDTKMRGAISEEEVERLIKEQRETKNV